MFYVCQCLSFVVVVCRCRLSLYEIPSCIVILSSFFQGFRMSFAFDGLFFFYLSYFQYNIFQRSIVSHIIQKSRNFLPVAPVGLYDFCNSRLYSSKLRVDLLLPRTTFLQNFSGLFLSIRTFSNFFIWFINAGLIYNNACRVFSAIV